VAKRTPSQTWLFQLMKLEVIQQIWDWPPASVALPSPHGWQGPPQHGSDLTGHPMFDEEFRGFDSCFEKGYEVDQ